MTGDPFDLQKKTLLGWEDVQTIDGEPLAFFMGGYLMDDGAEKTWTIKFEALFGKLSPGIYRISKGSCVDGIGKYSEEEIKELNLEPTVYATFVVWPWD